MKSLLVYHYPCADGAFAALAMYLSLRAKGQPNIVFVPHSATSNLDLDALRRAHHSDTDARLYLLNYMGPDEAFLARACALFKHVTLIDHHESNVPTTAFGNNNLVVVLDRHRSGCMLALEHGNIGEAIITPELKRMFYYVQDDTLWRHSLPRTREFTAGLQALRLEWDYNKNPALIQTLTQKLSFSMIADAGALELARRLEVASYERAQLRSSVDAYLATRYWADIPNRTSGWAVDVRNKDCASHLITTLCIELAGMNASGVGIVTTTPRDECRLRVYLRGTGHASEFSVEMAEWREYIK
jgi:hypothetical protein